MPALPTCRAGATVHPAVAESCAKGDAQACWQLAGWLWDGCIDQDPSAAATIFRRACDLSGEPLHCWVAGDLMGTRIFAPHDQRDLAGSGRVLARVCESVRLPQDEKDLWGSGYEPYRTWSRSCLDAARALRATGEPTWTRYAELACKLDSEQGCILAMEALPLADRYAALVARCERATPKSLGGTGPDEDPDKRSFSARRFDACLDAARIYEENPGTLAARPWTTPRGVAGRMVAAIDGHVLVHRTTLARIPRAVWPSLPKGWAVTAERQHVDVEVIAEQEVKDMRLDACLHGYHDACDPGWELDVLPNPDLAKTKFAREICYRAEGCRGGNDVCEWGEPFSMGMACAYLGGGSMNVEPRTALDRQQEFLVSARRGCWLDDWTCGVYARALQLTGGPSNDVAFEYRRACAAGNQSACGAMDH